DARARSNWRCWWIAGTGSSRSKPPMWARTYRPHLKKRLKFIWRRRGLRTAWCSCRKTMSLKRKDLLGIQDLTVEEINLVLETAESFKEVTGREIKKVPTLRGKTVVNLFFEPSTRTRTSFELAAKRLSADVINFAASTSSVVKGETLLDTARNIEAMQADFIVLRHPEAGAPNILARLLRASVINAGDGGHEHPTQALLDLYTLREKKRAFKGLRLAIVGDIAHSRVARSNIYALVKLGAEVRVAGPPTMMPQEIERLGVTVFHRLDEALRGVDDVLIQDGKIAQVATELVVPPGATVMDASGKWVLPGFVDLHVHLREPGFEYKETIQTGTSAAVAGGFTSVCCMPNTSPVNDNQSVTEFILDKARAAGLAHVFPIGAITKGSEGKELAEFGELKDAGCVAVSDDGKPVMNGMVMRRAL